MKKILMLLKLVKFPIILLSTLSAATGYILTGAVINLEFPLFLISLLMLAAGSAALNQVQDRTYDAKMERTYNRPIPAGDISNISAMLISAGFLLAGSLSLLFNFNTSTFFIGVLTVILYNGVYTYLKRITPYAVLPGALIGALPPAIGWSASGGEMISVTLAGLMFFFYLWQIPHFWLLLGIRSDEYTEAGYPVITKLFSMEIFSRIIFIWIAAVLCTGIFLPLFGIFSHNISMAFVLSATLYILVRSLSLIRPTSGGIKKIYQRSFNLINLFALAIIMIIIFEQGVLK